MDICIGNIRVSILAYVIKNAPADTLLGAPFLEKYSKGFAKMVDEFLVEPEKEGIEEVSVCASIETSALERILGDTLREFKAKDPIRLFNSFGFGS